MGRLGVRQARTSSSRARDPIVNGFTRLARGFIGKFRPTLAVAPFYAGTVVMQNFADGLDSVFVQTAGTVSYSNPGGYYMAQSGAYLNRAGDAQGSFLLAFRGWIQVEAHGGGFDRYRAPDPQGPLTSPIWLEYYQGRVRVWSDGVNFFNEAVPQNSKIGFGGRAVASDNPDNAITGGKSPSMQPAVAMRRRDLEFAAIPDGGYVLASIAGGAQLRVDAGDNGAGVLAIPDGIAWPQRVAFDFRRADGSSAAAFTLAEVWGGDVIGNKLAHVVDPASFTVQRTASGVLFDDDFSSYPNGPAPAAKYATAGATWSIVGGKLVVSGATSNQATADILPLAAVKSAYLQMSVRRSSLALYANARARIASGFFYQFDTGASTDADPNEPRIYSQLDGQWFKIGIGTPGQSGAAGSLSRMAFTMVADHHFRFAMNGAVVREYDDPNARVVVAGGVQLRVENAQSNPGSSATWERIVATKDRALVVRRLPLGWSARVDGIASAPADATGRVSIDPQDAQLPLSTLEVVDGAGVVRGTFTPASGIFGGDVWSLY